jgi:hypothetical protein
MPITIEYFDKKINFRVRIFKSSIKFEHMLEHSVEYHFCQRETSQEEKNHQLYLMFRNKS